MAERALREENMRGIKIAWPFIHAARLSQHFAAWQPEDKPASLAV